METRHGTPVSPGVVIGPAYVLQTEGVRIPRQFIMPDEAPAEIERFRQAVEEAREECRDLHDKVAAELDQTHTEIFKAHLRMLEDTGWTRQVEGLIRNKHFTAEFALGDILRRYINSLERLGDPHIAQRTADIFDIERRVRDILMGGRREDLTHLPAPVVIVAPSLTPSQTVSLARDKILAFVTDAGGRTSHTAILARALGIPAVVGLGDLSQRATNGDTLVVDGGRGTVIIAPDPDTVERYKARERDIHSFEVRVSEEVRGLPAVTQDGRHITLLANIEFPSEVESSVRSGAAGVGLYRTEFLYHSVDSPPDEDAHYAAYAEAMDHLGDRPITIRLLDLGADKFPDGRREDNPFLGCRSIRLLLNNEPLLRTQLRAIFRASVLGNPRIMLPLVSTAAEIHQARRILEDVRRELHAEGVPFREHIPLGIMIEVPSAAVMADVLARHCEFFSIGTNDLIQYALAVDRGNADVAHLFSAADPAVLRLIRTTVAAARRHDLPVSVCGEMAGELLYIALLVGLGLTELSVAPKVIPEAKKLIRSLSYADCRELAREACDAETADENLLRLEEMMKAVLPEVLD